MAFVPVISKGGGPWTATARVAITISKPYHGEPRHSVVHLTRPVLDELNWRAADRIFVSLGVGPDFGKFQMVRVKAGGSKLSTTTSKNNFTVSFMVPEIVGNMKRADFVRLIPQRIFCEFAIENGVLQAELLPVDKSAALRLVR